MASRIKYLKKGLIRLLLALVMLLRGFSLYEAQWSLTDTVLMEKRGQYTDRVEVGYHDRNGREVHYLDLGATDKPMVVLIHGAPGSINDWSGFLRDSSLYDEFRFVVVDRLGYGRSGQGKSVTSLNDQSESIISLVTSLSNSSGVKPLIMGHSYGGTIAAKMIMEASQDLAGGIIVSGAVDPDYEVVFWISYLVNFPILKQLIGPMLRVANDEKLAHVDELKESLQTFGMMRAPTHIIHGDRDRLVPFENAEYLYNHLNQLGVDVSMTVVSGGEHPLHFTDVELLREELRVFYNRISK